MKLVAFLLSFTSMSLFADIKTVNIDKKFEIKYESTSWNYHFLKIFNGITPHVLEHRDHNKLKVIIQKETHLGVVSSVEKKCVESGKFYEQSNHGKTKTLFIKNKPVCFIELVKNQKKNFQIIYPISFEKTSYDLISFSWVDEGADNLKKVELLVSENL